MNAYDDPCEECGHRRAEHRSTYCMQGSICGPSQFPTPALGQCGCQGFTETLTIAEPADRPREQSERRRRRPKER